MLLQEIISIVLKLTAGGFIVCCWNRCFPWLGRNIRLWFLVTTKLFVLGATFYDTTGKSKQVFYRIFLLKNSTGETWLVARWSEDCERGEMRLLEIVKPQEENGVFRRHLHAPVILGICVLIYSCCSLRYTGFIWKKHHSGILVLTGVAIVSGNICWQRRHRNKNWRIIFCSLWWFAINSSSSNNKQEWNSE